MGRKGNLFSKLLCKDKKGKLGGGRVASSNLNSTEAMLSYENEQLQIQLAEAMQMLELEQRRRQQHESVKKKQSRTFALYAKPRYASPFYADHSDDESDYDEDAPYGGAQEEEESGYVARQPLSLTTLTSAVESAFRPSSPHPAPLPPNESHLPPVQEEEAHECYESSEDEFSAKTEEGKAQGGEEDSNYDPLSLQSITLLLQKLRRENDADDDSHSSDLSTSDTSSMNECCDFSVATSVDTLIVSNESPLAPTLTVYKDGQEVISCDC